MKYIIFTAALTGLMATAVANAQPEFEPILIDAEVKIGYGVSLSDVDGDGVLDIVLVDKDQIRWYRGPSYQPHVIVEKLTERDHVCLAARDIDGDGKAEVAAGAEWNPGDTLNSGSVHLLTPTADRREKWTETRLPNEPTTHRMRWRKSENGNADLIVVPLHGRGNRLGRGAGVRIEAYLPPGNPDGDWERILVSDAWHVTHNIDLVHWDAEPGEEILVSANEGLFLCRWRGYQWTTEMLVGGPVGHEAFEGASEVRLGRLTSGSRFMVAVEPFHGNRAVAYVEDPAGPNGWRRRLLDDGLNGGHAVATGDVLGKGYDQVVVGWRLPDAQGEVGIRLYDPISGDGDRWETHWLDRNQMACEDLRIADMDGDGRLDIVAAGRASNNLILYRNQTEAP